jgi:hypothetical protein
MRLGTRIACGFAALAMILAGAFQARAAVEAQSAPAVASKPGLERLEGLAREAQPAVAEMIGLEPGEPVPADIITRAELMEHMRTLIDVEYPDNDLQKRSRCFWELGLVPRGYDLEEGMLTLIAEQAGAIYDPYTKRLIGLSDLPPQLQDRGTQRLIVSHELCHALQDREVDIVAQARICLTDVDREYAFRATIEGMATVLMLAYSQDRPMDGVGDARGVMRAGFASSESNPGMRALAASPLYLKETLLSPYAEGAAFNQAWLKANPGSKLGALLERMPLTSEQVLHFDKYAELDQPAPIDLSSARAMCPAGWPLLYANTLGEFDLLMLFEGHGPTRGTATDAAAGWDGLKFEAYAGAGDEVTLVGCSAWDSESDAREFAESFTVAVGAAAGSGRLSVLREGATVGFVVGFDKELRDRILAAVVAANRAGD